MQASAAAVDLYWIPLGAGGHSVRFNGKVSRRSKPRATTGGAATFTTPRS
jgi:hypothetical protein